MALLLNSIKVDIQPIRTLCIFSASWNKWRLDLDLREECRLHPALKNNRDYSFVDGRPTPLSNTKKNKVELQKKYCERIAELSYEMDFALKKYNEKMEEHARERQAILDNKLKPKGAALLYNKKLGGKSV